MSTTTLTQNDELYTNRNPDSPISLIESLAELHDNSQKSAQKLCAPIERLIKTISGGSETRENRLGIAKFQQTVESLSQFISRLYLEDDNQALLLSNIKGLVHELDAHLQQERKADYNPLSYFRNAANAGSDTDSALFTNLKAAVIELKELLMPQPMPTHGIHLNMIGAYTDTRDKRRQTNGDASSEGRAIPFQGGSIGSNIQGYVIIKAAGGINLTDGQPVYSNLYSGSSGTEARNVRGEPEEYVVPRDDDDTQVEPIHDTPFPLGVAASSPLKCVLSFIGWGPSIQSA